jgi:carbon starvation protein
VWLLLCPRDYLSSFLKIGTILLLVIGVIVINPTLKLPAITEFVHGGGPIVPGKVFPFVFITIMCGAVSGFHALVSSGTTPKMVSKESDCRAIGYGAMLIEGLVGIVALIAVSHLAPGDYFAINVPKDKMPGLNLMGYHIEELPVLEQQVEEKVEGRTGGAVSLAIGMAKIFSALPGFRGLMAYWYHFAIMFEALFILTTIDTGTRIARFVLQETMGKVLPKFSKNDWLPGTILTSLITVCAWGYFIYTGSISTIWPMFGIANQLLAAMALCLGTTIILKTKGVKYIWVTLVPMCFVLLTTTTAAWEMVTTTFWSWTQSSSAGERMRGYADIGLTVFIVVCVGIVIVEALRRWFSTKIKTESSC